MSRQGTTQKEQEKKKKQKPENQEEDLLDETAQDESYQRFMRQLKRRKLNKDHDFSNRRAAAGTQSGATDETDGIQPTVDSARTAMPHDGLDQKATKEVKRTKYKRHDGAVFETDDGQELYKGLNEYVYKAKAQDKEGVSKTQRIGPGRAPANHLPTCIFDYQPDICKDYKETGYCGYGDSCKFLHDRTDYKYGWQIENDWQEAQKKKKARLENGDDEEDDESDYEIKSDEELPFACYVCREEFKNPVKTKCDHYFCSQCAMDSYRKTPACQICGTNTEGLFSAAPEIKKRLREKNRAKNPIVFSDINTRKSKVSVNDSEVLVDDLSD